MGDSLDSSPGRMETVQTFGRKREAVAVAFVKKGKGLIKVNGVPIELVQPETLRFKVWEPVLLLGANRYREVDIRIRVKGGGYSSQIYAIRQAIGKALVAWYQKYVDEASKREIKDILMNYDRTLLVADPAAPSPRSLVVAVRVLASRSPTVKHDDIPMPATGGGSIVVCAATKILLCWTVVLRRQGFNTIILGEEEK